MRFAIYILTALLTLLCFSEAMGQAVVNFGVVANRPQDTSKTRGQIVATAYATNYPGLYFTINSSGHFVLDTLSEGVVYKAGYGISISNDTINIDSALLNGFYVKLSDSSITYVTPFDLQEAISNIPVIDLTGIRDTTQALYDSVATLRNDIDNIPIPTWQQTANQNREADSVLVSDNLYVSTTENAKPVSFRNYGDSWDRPSTFYVPFASGWAQRMCKTLGWSLLNYSTDGSTFLSEFPSPFPNPIPANDSGFVWLIRNGYVRNVAGLTDSVYKIGLCRGLNDAQAWRYSGTGGASYNPAAFSAALRWGIDTLVTMGYTLENQYTYTKYVLPSNVYVGYDSLRRYNDSIASIANEKGINYFDGWSWMQQKNYPIYVSDSFHPNIQGQGAIYEGWLHASGYQIVRDDQAVALNGELDVKSIRFRGTGDRDTLTPYSSVVMRNEDGYLFAAQNQVVPFNDTSATARPTPGNINVSGTVKARDLEAGSGGGISLRLGNGSAIVGRNATNGLLSRRASLDGTGTLIDIATSQSTQNSSGTTQTIAFIAPIGNFGALSGGNGLQISSRLLATATASTHYMNINPPTGWTNMHYSGRSHFTQGNGTLVSAPTATIQIAAGTAAASGAPLKFTTTGAALLTIAEAGVMEVNTSGELFYTPTASNRRKIVYTNTGAPANGSLPIGNGTDYTNATLTGTSGVTVTNSAGGISLGLGGTALITTATDISTTTIVANASLSLTDVITTRYVDATAGNITITITPTAAGQMIKIKRLDGSVNTVTVQGASGQIDGSASVTIPPVVTTRPTLSLQWDGTNYLIY